MFFPPPLTHLLPLSARPHRLGACAQMVTRFSSSAPSAPSPCAAPPVLPGCPPSGSSATQKLLYLPQGRWHLFVSSLLRRAFFVRVGAQMRAQTSFGSSLCPQRRERCLGYSRCLIIFLIFACWEIRAEKAWQLLCHLRSGQYSFLEFFFLPILGKI